MFADILDDPKASSCGSDRKEVVKPGRVSDEQGAKLTLTTKDLRELFYPRDMKLVDVIESRPSLSSLKPAPLGMQRTVSKACDDDGDDTENTPPEKNTVVRGDRWGQEDEELQLLQSADADAVLQKTVAGLGVKQVEQILIECEYKPSLVSEDRPR